MLLLRIGTWKLKVMQFYVFEATVVPPKSKKRKKKKGNGKVRRLDCRMSSIQYDVVWLRISSLVINGMCCKCLRL